MSSHTQSFDFVVVGSGGGGLVAALAAKQAGLQPVIIEKQPHVGGSTGMSGGAIWMPANPLMLADGVADSIDEGLQYFDSVVGPPDRGSSMERRRAFLNHGPEMLAFLQRKGIRLIRCAGYSDYYDNRRGGSVVGRSVEGVPWDGRVLGEWHERVIAGMPRGLGLAAKANEVRSITAFSRSPAAFGVAAKVVARTYISRALGRDLFTMGMSLIGQLTKLALDEGIPIWLDTATEGLVVENGRVVGVSIRRDDVSSSVSASHGVMLAAGGFERNAEMRRKYSFETQPNDGEYTMGNVGNTGEVLAAAIGLGAQSDYMDEAIWAPGPRAELASSSLRVARQYPGTILVNRDGRRFCNEANSYVEVGKAMYEFGANPAWLIFDDGFRRRYPWGKGMPKLRNLAAVLPGRLPKEWIAKGWIRCAGTIEDLARLIGLAPEALQDTVCRFNQFAARGSDPDFGRGESQYNRVLGDPGYSPNSALGPLGRPPFYATEIFPADVGTAGGVVTNADAQVIGVDDHPIEGLYATGNMTASVMGRTYPGAGASIANSMIFGYLGALHASRVQTRHI
jgi:3-oxosteroid 1-dehydrogenase